MSIIKFAIDTVLPNPYQTRKGEDAEHIRELATSIAAHGILQTPLGRMSPTQNGRPELAFGHSRLSAQKYLASASIEELDQLGIKVETPEEHAKLKEKFSHFEIDIKVLSDVELFELAVTENHDRKDLNPLEEAQAMAVYRDTFGKNSDQIGELFHLSGSAVRNKLRLLDLPESIVPHVEAGSVSEGVARELLAFYALPEEIRKKESSCWDRGGYLTWNESILHKIKSGNAKAEDIKNTIDHAVSRHTIGLDAKPFKHDEILLNAENNELPSCKGCPHHITRDKKELCTNPACFHAKVTAWKTAYLQKASLLSGIPVLEHTDNEFKSHTQFVWNATNLKAIRARGGCENLRLVYQEPYNYKDEEDQKVTNMIDEGFPNAMICCMKKDGYCTCIKALQAGVDVETNKNGQVSEAQLKEARAKMNERKAENKKIIISLKKAYADALKKGLDGKNIRLYFFLLGRAETWYFRSSSTDLPETLDQLYLYLCDNAANNIAEDTDPKGALNYINRLLAESNLPPLDITLPDEPEKTPAEIIVEQEEDEYEDDEYDDEDDEDWERVENETDARAELDESLTEMNTL